MLIGKRIILRPLKERDLEKSRQWVNDWEICRGLLRYLPVADFEHKEWFKKLKSDEKKIVFAIEIKSSKKYIGNVGLRSIDWRNRNADFFIYIGEKTVWNKGYGTEATALFVEYCFKTLNLRKVYLRVAEYNKGAIRAYEKVGFKKEGALKDEIFAEGKYHNVVRMAIIHNSYV